MSSLNCLPDEIIHHILTYVSPEDNLSSVQLVSRRLNHVANETLLWRYHCQTSFSFWHPDHRFQDKLASTPSHVEWKKLWIERTRNNATAARLLDDALATKVGRYGRIQQICLLGYDVKDFLLEQCRVDESAEDVLARRYYANCALDSIHRGAAVEVWSQFQGSRSTACGLDCALGAFDLFVLHDREQDLDYISQSFDSLAEQFRQDHPGVADMPTRQKALKLVGWLRAKNLTGLHAPDRNYYNLRNCFIGHALSEEDHPSLPLISSAIFCCVAERLGMESGCCSFPSHVHASVLAPPGYTLDGDEKDTGAQRETMYLDPYGSDYEVTLSDLRLKLVEFGWMQGTEAFLVASPIPAIVQRMSNNIKNAYNMVQSLPEDDPAAVEMKRLRAGYPELNVEATMYAAVWADIMMKKTTNFHWDANLPSFLHRFAIGWAEDAWIVEKYLLPLYEDFVNRQPIGRRRDDWENVRTILDTVRNLDQRRPEISRRYTQEIQTRVLYKIGQVFRHKRYGYIGIINGWTTSGAGGLPSPHYLTAEDALEDSDGSNAPTNGAAAADYRPARRPAKTFYTCLRPSVDRLRVDQKNIEIITDPSLIPDELYFLAGKFFKRFDRETCTFVSNIKEVYPDD